MLYGPDNSPIASGTWRQASRPDARLPLLASLREEQLRRTLDEWRREMAGSAPAALPPQEALLRVAYWMFQTSGLYRAIIKNKTNVICGDGFGWSAKDERIQQAIRGFWNDRINALNLRIEDWTDETSVYGELFLLLFVNKSSGRLRLGQVMPWQVTRVLTDPENPLHPIGIRIGQNIRIPILTGPDTPEYERRNFSPSARVRRAAYQPLSADSNLRGCLFTCVNRRVVDDGSPEEGPQLRGTPDLFAATDTIQGAETVLRDANDRVHLMNRILYDVTLDGADQDKINEFLAEISSVPDAYTINAHNERVRWQVQTPDLRAAQSREAYEVSRDAAISSGGAGQPPTWFAEGNITTKASADSMPFPTMKGARRRQQVISGLVQEVTAYQLYALGLLSPEQFDLLDTEEIFSLQAPTINEQDMEMLMRVHTQMTASLNVGVSQGWITQEEAARFYRSSLSEARNEELGQYEQLTQDALRDLLNKGELI